MDTVSATVGSITTDHMYTYQANSALLHQLVQKRMGVSKGSVQGGLAVVC